MLERDVKKFTAADVGSAHFDRVRVRVPVLDADGEAVGHTKEVRTTLVLGFVVDTDTDEVHQYDVGPVSTTVLSAAWAAFTAAQETAILDGAWADFKKRHKLTEV